MFSNVGMNPYGPGGTIVSSQAQAATSPGADTRSAVRGEPGSSGVRAETSERVDPPKQGVPVADLPQGQREQAAQDPASTSRRLAEFSARFTPLQGPFDGDADRTDTVTETGPAGPPPAFRRSLLDAQRDETAAPDPAPATISAPQPPDRAAAQAEPTVGGPAPADPVIPAALQAPSTATGSEAPPGDDDDPLVATIRRLIDEGAANPVPPTAEARAEAEFAGLRRMAAPYDTATVDVSR